MVKKRARGVKIHEIYLQRATRKKISSKKKLEEVWQTDSLETTQQDLFVFLLTEKILYNTPTKLQKKTNKNAIRNTSFLLDLLRLSLAS